MQFPAIECSFGAEPEARFGVKGMVGIRPYRTIDRTAVIRLHGIEIPQEKGRKPLRVIPLLHLHIDMGVLCMHFLVQGGMRNHHEELLPGP